MKLSEHQNPLADVFEMIRQIAARRAGGAAGEIKIELPRDPSHGDLSTTAAMVLSKVAGRKPRDLAEEIAADLRGVPAVREVSIAGPGFINLKLADDIWRLSLKAALSAAEDWGRTDLGAGRTVNIEYVSANPTGPMHIGHVRGAVFGDALASLLDFTGHAVTREYYVNDAGGQIRALGQSVLYRYREALGLDVGPVPNGFYPGEYLKEPAGRLASIHGPALLRLPDEQRDAIIVQTTLTDMRASIAKDLSSIGISHDVFFSESSLTQGTDRIAEVIDRLRALGHVYEGRLPPPKGGAAGDWEDREQTLFRSTEFGDDVDRALKKADGSYTYFASDVAYHHAKITRGFDELIDVWGADHGGYVRRMKAAVSALGGPAFDVRLVQMVRLLRNGEPVRMSKRSGDLVTLQEVVEEVGSDAVRFDMLYRSNEGQIDFDLAKVVENTKDNPVFYVQYGHARARSILRKAAADMPQIWKSFDRLTDVDLGRLTAPGEIGLMKRIAFWPRAVEAAAGAREPHRIAHYLHDTVAEFHAHWTQGNWDPALRFIVPDDVPLTAARLMLTNGVAFVLKAGLNLLGVSAPDEMRKDLKGDPGPGEPFPPAPVDGPGGPR